jgi:Recombination endonuclease VII
LCNDERRVRRRARARKRYAENTEWRERKLRYLQAYRVLNKAHLNAQKRLKWATDPEHRKRGRRNHLRFIYGISEEEYAALLARQNGVCAICKKKDRIRLCVDHCHDTRTVRGLLCTKCNIGLGHFDDDIERLRAAIAYLQRAREKK